MSESGEISEFGYIMELLARGKVSAGTRGVEPRPGTPPRALPGPRLWASRVLAAAGEGGAGIPGPSSQSVCPSSCRMQSSRFFFFFPLELSGVSEMSQKGLGQLGEGGGFWDRKGREISLRG